MQSKEQMNGLRPFSEIEQLVREACPVKQLNPKDFYKIREKIGRGAFATIFKCLRISDQHMSVLKYTGISNAERQSVVNECSLIKALNCEYIVGCEDVFEHDKRIWVFLEYMAEGDLAQIVLNSSSRYSEAFCKFTLYSVARGLQVMH